MCNIEAWAQMPDRVKKSCRWLVYPLKTNAGDHAVGAKRKRGNRKVSAKKMYCTWSHKANFSFQPSAIFAAARDRKDPTSIMCFAFNWRPCVVLQVKVTLYDFNYLLKILGSRMLQTRSDEFVKASVVGILGTECTLSGRSTYRQTRKFGICTALKSSVL